MGNSLVRWSLDEEVAGKEGWEMEVGDMESL